MSSSHLNSSTIAAEKYQYSYLLGVKVNAF